MNLKILSSIEIYHHLASSQSNKSHKKSSLSHIFEHKSFFSVPVAIHSHREQQQEDNINKKKKKKKRVTKLNKN